jgi:hypothetical protein
VWPVGLGKFKKSSHLEKSKVPCQNNEQTLLLITNNCGSENTYRYKLVISSSMCCGITYLVIGVIRLNSSFSSLKPRTLVTEHKISLSKLKRNRILAEGVEKERS